VITYAEYYLFVKELYPNRSPEIDSFNVAVNVPLGSQWCGSFASWIYNHNNVINPNTAWSPSFSTGNIIWKKNLKNNYIIKKGDAVTFYNNNLKRVAHVEIVISADDKYIYTIGGNTGDRVKKNKIELVKCYAIVRYIK
jgi:hypothetical protein